MSRNWIETEEALLALYGAPVPASLRKVVYRLTPLYRDWIMASRFCVLSTVGPEGTDGSPRGDEGPVVHELDEHTLAMPDWHGNNRLDSLRNILRDERVSLMFFVPGSSNVVRVNGTARISADEDLRAKYERKGRLPATVIVIRITEIYAQCARAVMRAGLWERDDSADLPTVGQLFAEATDQEEGGPDYDAAWPARAAATLW